MDEQQHAPWIARFLDGPVADDGDRIFVVGPVWDEIELAPMPPGLTVKWCIVGGGPLGRCEHPWPGQVTYRLAAQRGPGSALDDPVAWYSLAD